MKVFKKIKEHLVEIGEMGRHAYLLLFLTLGVPLLIAFGLLIWF